MLRQRFCQRASVLIVSLWILVILTMLAVSIGHRLSLALKISVYARDALKARLLAKAALNRAVNIIDDDTNSFDALNEPWVSNPEVFEKITLSDNSPDLGSVNYTRVNDGVSQRVFGVVDEERKVQVQLAPKKLLVELCRDCYSDSGQLEEMADYIMFYRGDPGLSLQGVKQEYFKKAPLANREELLAVLEYFFKNKGYQDFRQKAREVFDCLNSKITVYGDGSIRINTVSLDVLTALLRSLADNADLARAPLLAKELIDLRESKLSPNLTSAPFAGADDLSSSDIANSALLLALKAGLGSLGFSKANYFNIETQGRAGKALKYLSAVYDRDKKKIVSWHEN